MAKISNFSDLDPSVAPTPVDREVQYCNRVANPGLQTIDADNMPKRQKGNFSVMNRSLIPQQDNKSVAVSGMIATRQKKMQTLTQYDLVPEVIYNALEIKIRELMIELTGPTVNRQQEIEKHVNHVIQLQHKFDTKLRDCQLSIKKQMNLKDEIDKNVMRLDSHVSSYRTTR